ncbi:MAG: hypothetical protein HQ513_15465 [Rhodospirillales bacterium]|nr:hypothetical protein [Rhodospirillales bacterium]
MNDGLSFVAFTLSLLGSLVFFGGIAFALSAINRGTSGPRLVGLWGCVAGCGWSRLLGETLKLSLAWLDKLVRNLFEEADTKPLLNILFLGLVLAFIPLAAAINALFGGSAFLFKAYLVMLAIVAVLAVTSQLNRSYALIAYINAGLAVVAGVGLLLGAPIYSLVSFTDRISHEKISHAFLLCLLIAPFYYVVAFSAMNYIELFLGRDPSRERTPPVLFVRRFLAAFAPAFVLVFLALLLGQLAVEQVVPVRTVQMLVISIAISAFSLPVTMCALSSALSRGGLVGSLLAPLNALITAIGLSSALLYFSKLSSADEVTLAESVNVMFGLDGGGGTVFLGPDFWVMHIPFLPILGVLVFFLIAVLAKAVSLIPGLSGRPNLASAALMGVVGVGLFVGGRLLV